MSVALPPQALTNIAHARSTGPSLDAPLVLLTDLGVLAEIGVGQPRRSRSGRCGTLSDLGALTALEHEQTISDPVA